MFLLSINLTRLYSRCRTLSTKKACAELNASVVFPMPITNNTELGTNWVERARNGEDLLDLCWY